MKFLRNSKRYSQISSFLLGFSTFWGWTWCFCLSSSVKSEGTVRVATLLNKTLLVEVSENLSGNWSVNLELITHNWHSESQKLWSFLGNSLICLCVKEDSIVKLFLYLYFGPTLLLSLSSLVCFSRCSSILSSFLSLIFALIFSGVFLCLYQWMSTHNIFTISLIWISFLLNNNNLI